MRATGSYRTHQISDGNNTYAMTTQKADLRAIAVTRDAILVATADYRFPIPSIIEWGNLPPLSHPSPLPTEFQE